MNHLWRSIALKYNIRTTLKYRNDMKQTAVEWLQEQIDNKDMGEIPMWIYDLIEKAKEMEKEQMALCYKVGVIDGNNGEVLNFEQYYNKTFNTKI